MKRIFFLIFILLMVADLADDGCLGKPQPVAFLCPGTISFTQSPDSLGKVEIQVWIPPTKLIGIHQKWQNQSVLVEVNNASTFIHTYLFSGSGGIPL